MKMSMKTKAVLSDWVNYTMKVSEKTGISVRELFRLAMKQNRANQMAEKLARCGAYDTVEMDVDEQMDAGRYAWFLALQNGVRKDTEEESEQEDDNRPTEDDEPTVYQELNDNAVVGSMSTEWLMEVSSELKSMWGHQITTGTAPNFVKELYEKCQNELTMREADEE